jgi:type III secretion system needle length determinant
VRPVNLLPPFTNPATTSDDERERQDDPSISDEERFKKALALQTAANQKEAQQRVTDRKETQQRTTDRRDTQQRTADRKDTQRRAADEQPRDQSARESAEKMMSRRGLEQHAAAPPRAATLKEDAIADGDKPSDVPDDSGDALSQRAAEMAAARMGAEARMPGGPTRRGEDQGSATPDSDEAEPPSEDAPKGRERKASSSHDRLSEPAAPQASVADRILNNLSSKPEEPSAPTPSGGGADLAEVVREVADRMTIGNSGPAGQQEVRIVLKNQVLGGTEIRVSEFEGNLQVHFLAGNAQAESFLQARRQEIATALGERLRRPIRVEVTDRESEQGRAGEGATHAPGQPPARR